VETRIEITFEQAVFGTQIDLNLNLEDTCSHCKGTTAEPGYSLKNCDTCGGKGQVVTATRTIFGNIQQATVCPTCHGTGKVPEKVCSVCHGKGTERRTQNIQLKVPAGIDDGATIRLREHGEAIANGPKGDLYVHIRVKAHKYFTREGDLILSEAHIGMVEAALGTEIDVDTVDGPVRMKVPAGTQSGTDFKLSSHGVPHLQRETRGAHIVTIVVDTPTKLSKQQKELLEQFNAGSKKRGIF
jgi:molecular chaperone DnaJ